MAAPSGSREIEVQRALNEVRDLNLFSSEDSTAMNQMIEDYFTSRNVDSDDDMDMSDFEEHESHTYDDQEAIISLITKSTST